MTVEYFLNENTLVIMAHNNEKEGLTFLGAQMSKAEFEKSHPPNGLHAEIEPGVLCPDVKGRKGSKIKPLSNELLFIERGFIFQFILKSLFANKHSLY
ncbi:hypothetical protein ACQCP7_26340 [Ralstonia pseudosolanacearum]|uniref:hypothetical protein n=1 Tax=Ralstonia pseudosolanacearum TaxID=1310165 RepID=UPI003CF2F2EC